MSRHLLNGVFRTAVSRTPSLCSGMPYVPSDVGGLRLQANLFACGAICFDVRSPSPCCKPNLVVSSRRSSSTGRSRLFCIASFQLYCPRSSARPCCCLMLHSTAVRLLPWFALGRCFHSRTFVRELSPTWFFHVTMSYVPLLLCRLFPQQQQCWHHFTEAEQRNSAKRHAI